MRAVSFASRAPCKRSPGSPPGSYGFADLRAHRNWREAVRVAKEAAARREAELEEELRAAGEPLQWTRSAHDPARPRFFEIAHLVLGGLGARLDLTWTASRTSSSRSPACSVATRLRAT